MQKSNWIQALAVGSGRVARLSVLTALLLGASHSSSTAEDPPMFLLEWGSRGTGDGQFRAPGSVAVEPTGDVFVTEGDRVQRFTALGGFVLKWSGPFSYVDTDAAGTVYLLTSSPGRVTKYDGSGVFMGEFPVSLFGPIAVDATGENLYVVGGPGVRQYRTDGTFVRSWITNTSSLASNQGVAVGPSGHVYVGERLAGIYKYTAEGVFVKRWGDYGTGDGQIDSPYGVAVDADENVYVVDSGNNRIQKFTSDGVFLTKWGSHGTGDGQFRSPRDVAVDGDGNVYVADTGNDRIQKFGDVPTATTPTSWGRIKARYR